MEKICFSVEYFCLIEICTNFIKTKDFHIFKVLLEFYKKFKKKTLTAI